MYCRFLNINPIKIIKILKDIEKKLKLNLEN